MVSSVEGEAPGALLLTHDGWGGIFCDSWTRSASQFEAAPSFQFAPRNFLGRHEISIGTDVTHRSFRGNSLSQPVRLLREDESLAEQIQFAGSVRLDASVTDVEEFIADHWSLSHHVTADLGGRFTSQTVGRSLAFAPRFGIAYSPGKERKTVLRAGTGLFYDRVPLLAADFTGNPNRIISDFNPAGQMLGDAVVFQNEYIANGTAPLIQRIRHSPHTSARSFVSSAEVDRTLWTGAVLRLSYLNSSTRDLFVIDPITGASQPAAVLGLQSSGRERYNDAHVTPRL